MKTFKFLNRWTKPDCYVGAYWEEYYAFLGQTRDSDTLTRSNFIEGLKALGGEGETVKVIRENHYAVGWVEWIAIHESDLKSLDKAEAMLNKIDIYPVLNEDAFSEMEQNEYYETWENCYNDDFAKELQKTFELRDSTVNWLLSKKCLLIALYEKGIHNGEYFINDNGGISCHPEFSIEDLTRKDIADFLKEWRNYYKEKLIK